jgi:hypothetical protein
LLIAEKLELYVYLLIPMENQKELPLLKWAMRTLFKNVLPKTDKIWVDVIYRSPELKNRRNQTEALENLDHKNWAKNQKGVKQCLLATCHGRLQKRTFVVPLIAAAKSGQFELLLTKKAADQKDSLTLSSRKKVVLIMQSKFQALTSLVVQFESTLLDQVQAKKVVVALEEDEVVVVVAAEVEVEDSEVVVDQIEVEVVDLVVVEEEVVAVVEVPLHPDLLNELEPSMLEHPVARKSRSISKYLSQLTSRRNKCTTATRHELLCAA